MTTWNQGPGYYPDPNQGYYGQAPPTAPYPGAPPMGAGYPGGPPPMGGYPGGPPPMGGYPGGPPPTGGYGGGPPPGAGFVPPPTIPQGVPYGHVPSDQPFNQPSGMYGTSYEDDNPEMKGFGFGEKSIRQAFIRKVYGILMCQLLVTVAFIALFLYHEPTKMYVQRNPALFIVALIVMLVTVISMACCESVRRKTPMNFIFLSLFTLAESFLLGVTSSTYGKDEVIMAAGITAAVCFALTLFAFQTKWDFTVMGGVLLVCCVVLLIFGIVAIFIKTKIVSLIYASLGALLFSFYLIYDTQMMMGGKHKYAISPEEYIFAALNLYMDIVNIFIYILQIIGNSRD